MHSGTRCLAPLPCMAKRSASDVQPAAAKSARGDLHSVVTQASSSSNVELKRIIDALQGEDVLRKDLTAARRSRLNEVVIHVPVDVVGGGTWQWPLCHPNLLLTFLIAESPPMQEIMRQALRASPCSREKPWRLIVGFDEFVPGNKLQLHSSRKAMNLSFTFLELGSSFLGEVVIIYFFFNIQAAVH